MPNENQEALDNIKLISKVARLDREQKHVVISRRHIFKLSMIGKVLDDIDTRAILGGATLTDRFALEVIGYACSLPVMPKENDSPEDRDGKDQID